MSRAVLVVDDDSTVCASLVELLALEGYRPLTAASGQEALTVIASRSPDVILLDMLMPGVTGWAVAQQLQAAGSAIPIVVMTAAPRGRAWADELHAVDYLAKPFAWIDVLATLDRVWSSRG